MMNSARFAFLTLSLLTLHTDIVLGWWWGGGGGSCSQQCLDNCYDESLYVSCGSGSALYRARSYHKNCREDRIWDWYCRSMVTSGYGSYCYWTGYQNYWDDPLLFRCPSNYFVGGVQSYHDNGREDRRWSFKCCRANQHYTRNCRISGYVNSWDGDMDYSASSGYAIVGAFSYHDNGREDRLWKFESCEYYHCPDYPNCGPKQCEHYRSGSNCYCKSGYKLLSDGRSCEDINECATNNGGCTQVCKNTAGSSSCDCYSGYQLKIYWNYWWWNSANCYDINECSSNNGGCQHKCTNMAGSYYCSCNTGYALSSNKKSCQDINECFYGNGGCQHGCSNTQGSYQCYCYHGYKLNSDGKTCSASCWNPCEKCASCSSPNKCDCVPGWTGPTCCSDVNECASSNGGCSQSCHNTHGSYYCSCSQGFQIASNDRSCNDINECALGTHGCEHSCANTYGSYKCYCNTGYVLDDNYKSCVDANECKIGNGGCDHTCTNQVGSYKCSCNDGYQLASNQHSCIDINECSLGTDTCEHNCYNTKGGYVCNCEPGYQLEGDHCSDINECTSGNNGCDHVCINEVGTYHCECNDGWHLDSDGMGCSDHDECQVSQHACEQECRNSHGTYVCSCNDGFKLLEDKKSCQDIDECAEHSSGCTQSCTNTIGSYTCECYSAGFILLSDKHTCQDIDECAVSNGGCEHECTNDNGGYTCSCQSGFQLSTDDLATCLDIDECDSYNGGCDQTCINNLGSYHCLCEAGYSLNDNQKDCDDKDECVLDHDCSQNCHNIIGTYYCSCLEGYSLNTNDNKTCKDVNECTEGEAGCDQLCTNSIGSYECSCKTGYELDGDAHTCDDVNECILTDNGGCETHCNNTEGSYICSCDNGFKLNSDGHSCDDINECQLNEHQCDHTCVNTIGSYECQCDVGFELDEDGFECIDMNECDSSNAGCEHDCVNTHGSYYCDCRSGFVLGNDSHNCTDIAECELNLCEQNCTEKQGTYDCFCIDGYTLGNDSHSCIDNDECEDGTSGCQQVCNNLNGTYECECFEGYTLHAGHHCEDIDECDEGNGGCEDKCTNTDGSYKCDCPPGYLLGTDKHSCPDIDECLVINGGCDQNCINENGTYHCTCDAGFTLHANGKDCDDIEECATYTDECNQVCSNTIGSYECSCNDGYTLATDGKNCTDINECSDESDKCDQLCHNTIGSYECSCLLGYELNEDMYSCDDINECDTSNGGCDHNCTNTFGSYECSCDEGYQLADDEHSCKDIHECDLNQHQCNHTCSNTIGSYECQCDQGYELDTDGYNCNDINECQDSNGGCDQVCNNELGSYSCECMKGFILDNDLHGCYDYPECDYAVCDQFCIETFGSYVCACIEGFRLSHDNHSCEDINECAEGSDNCHHHCNNTVGHYECYCEEGYRLLDNKHTCEDINECDINNGLCEHHCKNNLGSYKCSCEEGYYLDDNDHNCIAKACPKLDAPLHGYMDCLEGQVTNKNCSFSCETGYELNGHSVIHCLPNSTWTTSPEPHCTLSHCKTFNPPPNSYQLPEDCLTVYGSECETNCVEGYRHIEGLSTQFCTWDEETRTAKWSKPGIVCERIPLCESNPCLHNGVCSEGGNDVEGVWFTCDCSDTGYKGDICDVGVVEISSIPLLTTGVPSTLLKISAYPDDSLTVNLILDYSITSSIQPIHLDTGVNSALFQLYGHQEGVFMLSFELRGPASNTFEVPNPIVVLVQDNNKDVNITNNARLLPGCCDHDTPYYCDSMEEYISLSSSCKWDNQTSLTTSGMVTVNVNEHSFPLSIAGLEIDHRDSSCALPPTLLSCDSCNGACQSHIPSVQEFLQLLLENTLKQAFINESSNLFPALYSITLEADTESSNILYSPYDFMNYYGSGHRLIDEGLCSDLSVKEDELYVVALLSSHGYFQYGDMSFKFTDDSVSCVAVELDCNNNEQHRLLLEVPQDISIGFKESLMEMKFLYSDDQLIIPQAVLQRDGLVSASDLTYNWNGEANIDLSSEQYDTELTMSLEKHLASLDDSLSMNFDISGSLYYNSKASSKQFETTGMFRGNGKLSLAHSGSTLEMHLSNDPLYFSLPEYSSVESRIHAGISFKANRISGDELFPQIFTNSPGVDNCPLDCFVQLSSSINIKWVLFQSSCITFSINDLSFNGGLNGFTHTIILQSNDTNSIPPSPFSSSTNAPIQIVSDVPEDGMPLNRFMKVIQPTTEHAVIAEIWPQDPQQSKARIPMVEINLFDTIVTTQVMIDFKGVHFSYSDKLFGEVKAHVTVESVSGGDWKDIGFNISADIWQDQEFVSDMESSLNSYINNRVNLFSNRLSNLQKAQDMIYTSLSQQSLKINQSKAVSDTFELQYVDILNEIDMMKIKHEILEQSYQQSKEVNNGIYNDLHSVCSINVCSPECFPMPSFQSETDFDYVKEWKPMEGLVSEMHIREWEGMTGEKQCMVNKYCRPLTLIKGWGETSVGQECTYQSAQVETMQYKTSSVIDYENVPAYIPSVAKKYSYREDSTFTVIDNCGIVMNDTGCLYNNEACISAWKMIYNNSETAQKEMMKPLIDLVELDATIFTLSQELVRVQQRKEIAKMSYEMDLSIHQALQVVQESTLESANTLQAILTQYKSLVNEFDQFNITSLTMESRIRNGLLNNIADLRLKYLLPNKKENTLNLIFDTTLPLQVSVHLMTENFFNTLSKPLYNSTSYLINSQKQLYSYRCSSIESAKASSYQLLQILSNQNLTTLDSQFNVSTISNHLFRSLNNDLNISSVNYGAAEDLFATFITNEQLEEITVNRKTALLSLSNTLLQLDDDMNGFLENEVKLKYYSLLVQINSMHTFDKIQYIGGEICFGFFDCLKQLNYEMQLIHLNTPIKSTTYAPGLFDASQLFSGSQLFHDIKALINVLEGMTGYWCSDIPSYTDLSDVSQVIHIGYSHEISCGEKMQSELPIINYQWLKNGYEISGKNSETLVIDKVSQVDSGWYQCIATNDIGQGESSIWTLKAVEKPRIITDPIDTVTYEGNDNGAIFSCNATVQEGSVYSWYFSQYGATNWKLIASDSNMLVVESPLLSDEGWYRCQVVSAGITLVSQPAYLNVLQASVSSLIQEVSFDINKELSQLMELEKDIEASIVNQLSVFLQPQYSQILIKNISATENDSTLISLEMRLQYGYDPQMQLSVQAKEAFQYKQDFLKTMNKLAIKITSSQLALMFGGESFHATSLATQKMQYVCPHGRGLQPNNFICVDCLPGQFSNGFSECQSCSIGTYQPHEGSVSCIECPPKYSTNITGATEKSSCVSGMCEPGSMSETGFPPCAICEDGFYQLHYGGKICEKCLPDDYLVTPQCMQYNATTPSMASNANLTDDVNALNSFSNVLKIGGATIGLIGLAVVMLLMVISVAILVYKKRKGKEVSITEPEYEDTFKNIERQNPLYGKMDDEDALVDNEHTYDEVSLTTKDLI